MYYNNQFNNPFIGNSFSGYTQGNQLVRVTGIEGAKAYQMQANSTAALFDSGEDILYIKSTDGAGFPTIRTFKFSEVKQTDVQVVEYATKSDIDSLREEFINYGKQFIPDKQGKCKGYSSEPKEK